MSKKDIPEWNAAIMLAGNMCLNLTIIMGMFGWDDILELQLSKMNLNIEGAELMVVFYSILFLLNSFLFIKGGKYKQFIIEFEGKSKVDRRLSIFLGVILYFGGCIFPITYIILNLEIVK